MVFGLLVRGVCVDPLGCVSAACRDKPLGVDGGFTRIRFVVGLDIGAIAGAGAGAGADADAAAGAGAVAVASAG